MSPVTKTNQPLKPQLITQSQAATPFGISKTPGDLNMDGYNNLIQNSNPAPSRLVSQSVEVDNFKVSVLDDVLQWIMVILVLGACIYLAIANNTTDVIFNLATLCFGYYFGNRNSSNIINKK